MFGFRCGFGPLASKNSTILHDREDAFCALYGRLAPGVSLQQAQAEMSLLADRLANSSCATFGRQSRDNYPPDAWISHRASPRAR